METWRSLHQAIPGRRVMMAIGSSERARELKAKGEIMTRGFIIWRHESFGPVPFMSTLTTDKLYDEWKREAGRSASGRFAGG